MSKTSENARRVSRQAVVGLLALFSALAACASVDQPDTTTFAGNAYHAGGWLSCGTSINAEGKFLQFDASGDFLYSPRYAAPIRKIILEARCSAKSEPSRYLTVTPYVNGVEDSSHVLTNKAYVGENQLAVSTFEFVTADGVDAFKIGMAGSSGTWGIVRLAVIWGEPTADDENVLREFARQLPPPEDVHVEALSQNALTLAASPVEGALAYVFELSRLTGCPRTEIREDFVAAPNLADGWTFGETNNVKLSTYAGENSTSVDKESSADRSALKIERRNTNDAVYVEILSPVAPAGEPFCECSYWSKCSDKGSDQITAYGRQRGTEIWAPIADPHDVTTTKDRQTILLTAEQDISQVKFVFTAEGATCKSCAFDSLTVVYGGNEERTVEAAVTNAVAACEMAGLSTARYGYRVKALGATEGGEQFKDSSWSEEQVVDLAWADIELAPPTDVACATSGDSLVVTWSPVADAERYEVNVYSMDDRTTPVATVTTKAATASVKLEELGEYAVTVTAVSPGNVSTATTSVDSYEMKLGKLTGLQAEATDVDAIAATWNGVPLAEGYQAKLFKVEGEAGTEISDYSKLPEGVWPDGWEHSENWKTENLTTTGPKFTYASEWIETKRLPVGITRVTFVFKSHSSAAGKLANQYLEVEAYSERDGEWRYCAAFDVDATSQTTEVLSFDRAEDVRLLRIVSQTRDGDFQPDIQLGKVSVSYGEYVRTEVGSVGTKDCTVAYRGLDKAAKYVVVVTPQPSEGTELEAASQVIDLASEYFRPVGPVSVAGCKGIYLQRFDALAAVTKETDLRRVPLENWQFFKGSGEAEKLFYTPGTNSTKGGVYCYSDAERTTNSFMIGTVATSTMGSSVGLAFANDTGSALGAPTLTFTAVRRNEKPGDPYELEWLVTDGPWSIGTESDGWKSLPLTEGMPGFSVTPDDCRLAPGQVIIFRWRQEKVSGGPMLGLDDVHVEFPDRPGFMLNIR